LLIVVSRPFQAELGWGGFCAAEIIEIQDELMVRFPFLKRSHGNKTEPAAGSVAHDLEREQFRKLLQAIHASRISDRLAVLDRFLSVEHHLTLSSLAALMLDSDPALQDIGFLRDTMEMFCQCGFAKKRTFEAQEVTYEHQHLGDHHDHFICTSCGRIQEFHNPRLEILQMEIAAGFKFHALQHKMEIYGICADCLARREPDLPLTRAAVREKVRIVEVRGDRPLAARLRAMGLSQGRELEVINNNPAGPIIVALDEVRLALDAEMAEAVIVTHSCRHQAKVEE
jgi:Fur family ferric uptake transcriptional regulator